MGDQTGRRAGVTSSPPKRGEEVRGPDERATERARHLRRSQTDVERKLWRRLNNRQVAGCKFVRQEPIGPFFADFACRGRKLVVELDGSQHADNEYDRARDAYMAARGYRVLRFWNSEVNAYPTSVLDTIYAALEERAPPSPRKPGRRRRRSPAELRSGDGRRSEMELEVGASARMRRYPHCHRPEAPNGAGGKGNPEALGRPKVGVDPLPGRCAPAGMTESVAVGAALDRYSIYSYIASAPLRRGNGGRHRAPLSESRGGSRGLGPVTEAPGRSVGRLPGGRKDCPRDAGRDLSTHPTKRYTRMKAGEPASRSLKGTETAL
jgi:very-short-patch-repair endonuclease